MKIKELNKRLKEDSSFKEGFEFGKTFYKNNCISHHPLESFLSILNGNDIPYFYFETELETNVYNTKKEVIIKIKDTMGVVNFNFIVYDNETNNGSLTDVNVYGE